VDRLKAALAAFVRSVTSRLDYLALYSCKVLSQNGDGTLELQPDDARLPGLSKVPIRIGVPGVDVKVTPGAKVLLGFAGGDPRQPIAALFDKDSLKEITVTSATKVTITGGGDVVLNASSKVSITAATNVEITASAKVTVSAPDVALGAGAQPVARLGDQVVVNSVGAPGVLVPGTPMVGTIVAGNPQVKA
jgi:hypothetical protein